MGKHSNKGDLFFELIQRWPSLNAKRWAVSALRAISSHAATRAIIGIGSAVRTAHHDRSDIDFLVVSDVEEVPASQPPIDVDIRIVLTPEVERKIRECDDLLGWAIRFGRMIFERERYWTNLCAKWSSQLPFPAPKSSDVLAARFERFAEQFVSVGDLDAAFEQVVGMLTHRGRASLIRAGVYPASRPELPVQLQRIGEFELAEWLEQALQQGRIAGEVLDRLKVGAVEPAQV